MTTPVVFVLPSFAGGGAERVMLHLIERLDRSQFSPSLIVLTGEGPLANRLSRDVPLIDLARPRLRHAWPTLIGAIRRARPRAVVSSLGYVNLALLAGRWFLPFGTRLVLREANMPSLSLPASPRPGLTRWLYRSYYPRAHVVVCTSHMMVGEMAGAIGVDRKRLHVLPNPVDASAIREATGAMQMPEAGIRHFVASGRFTRQKGFDRLIALFADMLADHRLTILGDGPERPALLAECERRGVGGRIEMPGFDGNPWPYYASADAFLMPSRWEGMPNAALEALACGTPIIATPESGALAEVAAAAPKGAVTIAPWGKDFAAAVAELRAGGSERPRPSLLPPEHEPAAVARRFEGILRQIC